MYDIPKSINIEGKQYKIRNEGDYRVVLDCFVALNDPELTEEERVFASLIIFYEDINTIEDIYNFPNLESAVTEMFKFFNCGQVESPGAKSNYRLIDWQLDSQLVCSAINNVAGKEIRLESYIHWWTFMGYYMAVGDSPLATVVGIRSKIARGKKLEKYELNFKKDNPQYFVWDARTTKQKENDSLMRELWNNGK